jgi:hypothetical protein
MEPLTVLYALPVGPTGKSANPAKDDVVNVLPDRNVTLAVTANEELNGTPSG